MASLFSGLDCGVFDTLTSMGGGGDDASEPTDPSGGATPTSAVPVSADDDSAQGSWASIFKPGTAELKSVEVDFELTAEIGSGHFGRVYACKRRTTLERCACKQLLKRHVRDALQVRREVDILRKLNHPHILRIIDVYRGSAETVSAVSALKIV